MLRAHSWTLLGFRREWRRALRTHKGCFQVIVSGKKKRRRVIYNVVTFCKGEKERICTYLFICVEGNMGRISQKLVTLVELLFTESWRERLG